MSLNTLSDEGRNHTSDGDDDSDSDPDNKETFSAIKTWSSRRSSGDPVNGGTVDAEWSAEAALTSPNVLKPLAAHQIPWGAGNMEVGDVFDTTLSEGSLGTARLRTVFDLTYQYGIKGAPITVRLGRVGGDTGEYWGITLNTLHSQIGW